MTQIVLLLYEDPKADLLSEKRFHVELHFSPGAKTIDDPEFLTSGTPRSSSTASVLSFATTDTDLDEIEAFEPYDESVYTGNDTPRSEIGLDDYTDDSTSEERLSDKTKLVAGKRVSFELPREGEVPLNYCLNRADESWTLLSLPRRRGNTETVSRVTPAIEDPLPMRPSAPMKLTHSQDVLDEQPKEEEGAASDSGTGEESSGRSQKFSDPCYEEIVQQNTSFTCKGNAYFADILSQEDMSVVVPHQRATSFELVPGEGNNNHVGDQLQKFDESYIPSIERPLARRYSFGKEKQKLPHDDKSRS
ncbi:hypothetical protein pdam_00019296 [Pocillopora damicornis]|uniref:Uncharacterized protein n=1 Tax=Pocillopora damicornis TaxID=46731 RepID=A0A3M6TVY2_POCDA|nr:hypothetical protein pdam_00019296 [Pocillopora damicornis]